MPARAATSAPSETSRHTQRRLVSCLSRRLSGGREGQGRGGVRAGRRRLLEGCSCEQTLKRTCHRPCRRQLAAVLERAIMGAADHTPEHATKRETVNPLERVNPHRCWNCSTARWLVSTPRTSAAFSASASANAPLPQPKSSTSNPVSSSSSLTMRAAASVSSLAVACWRG